MLLALALAACTADPMAGLAPPPFDPTPWIGPPPSRPFPQPVDLDPSALRPTRAQRDLDADVLAAYARWV
ncbi:MAG TPA: hypothetical protein PKA64_24965, partial [Myxococcota bacterium]|nr:hypothetical protein [Myxococcota bacterium]